MQRCENYYHYEKMSCKSMEKYHGYYTLDYTVIILRHLAIVYCYDKIAIITPCFRNVESDKHLVKYSQTACNKLAS